MLGIFTAPLHFGLVVQTQSSRFKHCAVSKVFAEDSSLVGRSGHQENPRTKKGRRMLETYVPLTVPTMSNSPPGPTAHIEQSWPGGESILSGSPVSCLFSWPREASKSCGYEWEKKESGRI